jgi:hypothetical protein
MYVLRCDRYSEEIHNVVEDMVENLRRLRLNRNDFEFVRRLAKGQFGEVIRAYINRIRIGRKMME